MNTHTSKHLKAQAIVAIDCNFYRSFHVKELKDTDVVAT